MADEINIDDLQRSMDELRNSTQKSAMGVDEWNRKLKKAGEEMAKAAKQSGAELARGTAQFAKGLSSGSEDFKTFNDAIGAAGNAAAGLAKALPVVGGALSSTLQAATGAAQFLVTQLDATAKSFQTLANVGASTAGGMSALRDMQVKSGLSLQNFTKVVGDNSIAFARFGSTTGDGAERFSQAVNEFTTGNDNSLRNLGMNAEQIGQTTAAFIKQQSRLGRAQEMDARALQAGTKQYAMELDTLTKLTGMNKEAIQQQQDAALSEARFRANYEDLMDQGRVKEAQALMDLQTRMSSFGAELGQGIRDLTSGAANTDAAIKMMNSTGGAALDIVNRLKSGAIDQNQAQIELQAAYKSQRETLKQNAKFMGTSNEALGNFAQEADFMSQDLAKGTTRAKAATTANINADDALTASVVDAQKNIESMARELDKQIIQMLPKVGDAVKLTTDSFKKLTQAIDMAMSGDGAGKKLFSDDSFLGKIYNKLNGMMNRNATDAGIGGGTSSIPATADSVEKILATIRSRESGGNYSAQAKGSSASGAYQFIDSTWQAQAKKAGIGTEFKSAKEAPKEVQDAVAKAYISDILKQAGGDVSKVPLAWYTGNIQGKISDKALAANNGLRPEDYQSKWLNEYAKIGGSERLSVASGTTLSGPQNNYKPNLTASGTETVVATSQPTAPSSTGAATNTDIMMAQLSKLDEMVNVMKSQLAVSGKMLAYAS